MTSAGLLVWRRREGGPQFLLAHAGGPYWVGKDDAAWSIPKGMVEPGETPWEAARREFTEELGLPAPEAGQPLKPCKTPSGKTIHCWLVEADLDVDAVAGGLFELEWPPRSGRMQWFPEVDRAAYFDAAAAMIRIHKGQRPILSEAIAALA